MTNWLITGGCGFIGTSLIRRILQNYPEDTIRVLDNLSGGTKNDLAQVCKFEEITAKNIKSKAKDEVQGDNLSAFSSSCSSVNSSCLSDQSSPNHPCSIYGQPVELLIGDITESQLTEQATYGIDCLVHLAANTGVGSSVEDPRKDMLNNVLGTLNMLEAAQNHAIKRFVFASSSAPVGEVKPPVHEELAPRPVSPYGASKLAGEGYCSAYYRTFGLKTIALRFGNVYGPGSTHKTSVVAKFIKQAIRGETCLIYGDGSQTRDFIYIDDLVQAIIKATSFDIQGSCFRTSTSSAYSIHSPYSMHNCTSPWGETFQIATNKEHTVNEMTNMLNKELKRQGITMQVDYGQPMPGDILRNYSDTTKAYKILDWRCKTDLQIGLAKTVDWFLDKNNNLSTDNE